MSKLEGSLNLSIRHHVERKHRKDARSRFQVGREASMRSHWATGDVKRIPPDTAIHEQNGYAKVYDDKYTFITNVDNSDTTYKHKHNMREV